MNWEKIERLFGERFLPPEAMLLRLHADRDRVQLGRSTTPAFREWGIRIDVSQVSVTRELQRLSAAAVPPSHRDVG